MNNRQNEVKTICARDFKLNLSTADFDRLFEKAEGVGPTPSQLLENFIGDLVCGTYTNGSDERMCANEWFDRCGFSYLERPKSFLGWLLEYNTGDTICSYAMDWLMFSDYSAVDRLVLSGDKGFEALKRHLDQNPSIKNIAICFNADSSGDKAASELKDNLLKDGYSPENGYHCERQLPTGHTNFNEYLKSYRAALENGQHFQQEDVENIEQEP